jgi:hypothetical protein
VRFPQGKITPSIEPRNFEYNFGRGEVFAKEGVKIMFTFCDFCPLQNGLYGNLRLFIVTNFGFEKGTGNSSITTKKLYLKYWSVTSKCT